MVQMAKKQKRGTISEEDISTLLQRYSATTMLTLLQEVAQAADAKIDWKALVSKTATGITNEREFQMLWRHLAYRDTLLETLDDGAEPLSDDSDLEYEIEAFPSPSSESSLEAAACVKVLISSGIPRDASLPNSSTVEAPLTINIPNGPSSRVSSDNSKSVGIMKGTNITVPVSVQKQPLPTVTSAEGLDADGSVCGNLPPRRKRKPWSAAEDLELIAAVQKSGEGNWANILKGDFKGDRTASQLSQRWAIIRKRKGNLNVGGSSQLSEVQLAARRAMSLALDRPMVDNLKTACSNAGRKSNTTSDSVNPSPSEAAMLGKNTEKQSQQGSVPTAVQGIGTPGGSSSKFRVTPPDNKTSTSSISIDAMVKATAVAAGARIATPSDAATLLKAAQAKKAVHIMAGGSLIKPPVISNPNPNLLHLSAHRNVQHTTCSAAATPNASELSGGSTQQVQPRSVNPAVPTVQLDAKEEKGMGVLPEANNVATSCSGRGIPSCSALKEENREKEAQAAAISNNVPGEQAQENEATTISGKASKEEAVEDDQALTSGNVPIKQDLEEDQMT